MMLDRISCLTKDMGTPDAFRKRGISTAATHVSLTRAVSSSRCFGGIGAATAHGGCSNLPGSRALFSGMA